MRKNKMNKYLSPFILMFFLAAVSCQNAVSEPAEQEDAGTRVMTAKPELTDYRDTFTLAGDLAAEQDVVVASRLGEVVRAVPVNLGDRVNTGDLLAELDDGMISKQVLEAEANLTQKLANLTKIEKLFEKKAASRQQYIAAKTTYDMAEAQHLQMQEQLARTKILSPMNGRVVEKLVEEGEYVGPGHPLIRLVNIDRLKVRVNLPESEAGHVSVGDEVRIRIHAFPDLPVRGKISFVSSVLHPSTRTLPVEVKIRNPRNAFSAGMIADTTFERAMLPNVPVIPMDAVVTRKGVQGIWQVVDGKAVFTKVKIGNSLDNRVAVLEGLTGKEEIIVVGQRLLEEGQKVDPRLTHS